MAASLSETEKRAKRTPVLEQELAAASRELGETRRSLSLERAERVRAEERHVAASRSIRELEAARDRSDHELKTARNALRDMETERSQAERKFEATRHSAQKLEAERASAEQRLAAARSAIEELEAERTRSDHELTLARNAIEELEIERSRLASRLDASESQARASDVLERELATARARVADLEHSHVELANLRQTHQAQRDELGELKARLTDTSSRWKSEQQRAMASEALYQDAVERWAASEAELRSRAEDAESKLAELDRTRPEEGSANESSEYVVELEARAALAQADLREARMKLQASDAKLAMVEPLRAENLALREQGSDAAEIAHALSTAQAEVRELRAREGVVPRLEELDRSIEENRSLREQVAELATDRDAADGTERMTAEHKRLRLESELMARRLRELEGERAELFELRARVVELSSIADEVSDLRRREAELEAELFSTIRHSQTIPGVEGGVLHTLSEVDMAPDAESVLCTLIGPGRARRRGSRRWTRSSRGGSRGTRARRGAGCVRRPRRRDGRASTNPSSHWTNGARANQRGQRREALVPILPRGGIEYGLATIATGSIESVADERATDTLARVLSREQADQAASAAS